ncbi:MAG: glycosyltransferase family 2 protein [Candidatus Bathyarchaeota archaeon]|nr:glycosyltransferase family 2 protein [Candidatus Bathyarchaeota archaeon A05DMB-3]MDH7607126.1 glycosyltransferase family 2 protein [Candidatus Bathyarchaeota archaeon]
MQASPKSVFHPSVSIVIPAYNSEKFISKCLLSLFKNAAQYMGFCEIIVVDDGSSDCTYEIAWATIQECRRKWPNIHGKVVRHTTKLGRTEAVKTGVNKAFGTLTAIVDPQTLWKTNVLKELVEAIEKGGKAPNFTAVLYRTNTLREMLNSKTHINNFKPAS